MKITSIPDICVCMCVIISIIPIRAFFLNILRDVWRGSVTLKFLMLVRNI